MAVLNRARLFDDLAYGEWGLGARLAPIPRHPPDLARALNLVIQGAEAFVRDCKSKNPRMIDVYVDFLSDPRVNAVADLRDGLGLVGITQGAVLSPREMFQRMLSHPAILSGGIEVDTGLPADDPQFQDGLGSDILRLEEVRRSKGRPLETKQATIPFRREIAELLTNFSLSFLMGHEVAHIIYGHVGYVRSAHHVSFISELGGLHAQAPSAALTRQGLEIDADATGTTSSLAIAMGIHHNGFLVAEFDALFGRPEQRLFYWAFAISALFCLWGLTVRAVGSEYRLYPDVGARLFLAFITAKRVFGSRFPDLQPSFDKVIRAATTEVLRAVLLVGGSASDFDAAGLQSGLLTPAVQAHLGNVLEHFHTQVAPRLEQFSYAAPGFRDSRIA